MKIDRLPPKPAGCLNPAAKISGFAKPPNRVLIPFSTESLGLGLMITPLLRELKKAFPRCEITLITDSNVANILKNNPHISTKYIHRCEFDSAEETIVEMTTKQGPDYFDTLLVPSISESMLFFGQIDKFFCFGQKIQKPNPMSLNYSIRNTIKYEIPTSLMGKFMGNQFLRSILPFGTTPENPMPEIFTTDADSAFVDRFLSENGISPGNVVGVNAGAGELAASKNTWPLDNFLETAEKIHMQSNSNIVFSIGFFEYAFGIKKALVRKKSENNWNWLHTFEGSIHQLSELMRRCRFFLGHDTGTAHLAGAVNTPTITLFSDEIKKSTWFYPRENAAALCPMPGRAIDSIPVNLVLSEIEKKL